MQQITAVRYHDIDAGHRVVGHEGKCQHWHGHSYRVHFTCMPHPIYTANIETPGMLDEIGRVIDFSVIKEKLCEWLEKEWDHRFLAWEKDTAMHMVLDSCDKEDEDASNLFRASVVWVPFNPTAENMALYLLLTVGPKQLESTGVVLKSVMIEETRKCAAEASL